MPLRRITAKCSIASCTAVQTEEGNRLRWVSSSQVIIAPHWCVESARLDRPVVVKLLTWKATTCVKKQANTVQGKPSPYQSKRSPAVCSEHEQERQSKGCDLQGRVADEHLHSQLQESGRSDEPKHAKTSSKNSKTSEQVKLFRPRQVKQGRCCMHALAPAPLQLSATPQCKELPGFHRFEFVPCGRILLMMLNHPCTLMAGPSTQQARLPGEARRERTWDIPQVFGLYKSSPFSAPPRSDLATT